MDHDWEPLLYAKMFDYAILPSLHIIHKSNCRRNCSHGNLHSCLKELLLFIICIDLNFSQTLILLFISYS